MSANVREYEGFTEDIELTFGKVFKGDTGKQGPRGINTWGSIGGSIDSQRDLKEKFDSKADGIAVVNMTDTTASILPNKFYVWGTVSALNITLATDAKTNEASEYSFQFTTGTSFAGLNLPSSVKWIGDDEFEPGSTYQVSIQNNLAVKGGVSNE